MHNAENASRLENSFYQIHPGGPWEKHHNGVQSERYSPEIWGTDCSNNAFLQFIAFIFKWFLGEQNQCSLRGEAIRGCQKWNRSRHQWGIITIFKFFTKSLIVTYICFQTTSTNVTVTSFVSMTTFKMEPWEFLVPLNRFYIYIQIHSFCYSVKLRGEVNYYFADFVRKGGGWVPPNP